MIYVYIYIYKVALNLTEGTKNEKVAHEISHSWFLGKGQGGAKGG